MNKIIYEYDEILDENLKKHIINNEQLHKYFKETWGKVKARQYCGIINYNNEDFYILPKITKDCSDNNLDIFIYMLRHVYDIKVENEDLASSKSIKSNNLLEIFIQMFAKNLFKQFQKGIYKEYITEQDNLTTLRGKYLINENFKYNFTKNKIYCEYDEFSEDNSLNQFFLYTVRVLQKYAKNKKMLKQCELILNEVEYKQIDINRVDIHFNRLNQRFKNSFEFAMLLLNKSIPLFSKDKKSFAFLFDMNVLFEKFIAKIVKESFNDVEIPKSNKEFGDLSLRPDIIVKSENLIIDCKYKIIDDKKASREDKYQMYIYEKNYEDINKTMLLYPMHLKDIDKNLFLGKNKKKVKLLMKSINLYFDGIYSEYIKKMKNRMERINEN